MNESELLATARALAEHYGWERYHTHNSVHSEPGFPDLVLAKPDRGVMFVELKRRGARLTPAQERWLWVLEGEGHETKVAWTCPDGCSHPDVTGVPSEGTCGVAWFAWRLGPNGTRTRDVGELWV